LHIVPASEMEIWESEFASIDSLQAWNNNVIGWMHLRGDEYKRYAHAEAKKRGYEFDKPAMQYREPWKMHATKGHNIIAVGWRNGVLRAAFASKEGARFYLYGDKEHPVPEAEMQKFINSPFPDRLVTTNLRGRYPTVRE